MMPSSLLTQVSNLVKTFLANLHQHLIYTAFIILLSAIFTGTITTYKLPKTQLTISSKTTQAPTNTNTIILPNDTDSMYVERGSPYDNRSIDDATMSANVIFHGPRNQPKIALTFDAEMTQGMANILKNNPSTLSYDHRIIDILDQTHTKATIFLTGLWIELYPNITQQLAKDPLIELGSHSYTDSSYYGFCYGLKQIDNTVKIEEIGATEKLLREHAGIDNRLFRFPGGCYTPKDVALVNQANDTVVHWDVSGADGFNINTDQIIHNITDNTQNGSIIILHLNGAPNAPKTAEALPTIISTLKAKGYTFVNVSELLSLPSAPKTPTL